MSMSFPIEVMQDGQIEMLCEQYRKEKKQRLREFRRIKRVFLINMGEGKAFLIDALPFRIPFLMFFLLRVQNDYFLLCFRAAKTATRIPTAATAAILIQIIQTGAFSSSEFSEASVG